MSFQLDLQTLQQKMTQDLESIQSLQELEELRSSCFGKKGLLSQILRGLGSLSPQERPAFGEKANQTKAILEKLFEQKKDQFEKAQLQAELSQTLDVTLPARKAFEGALHPITQTIQKMVQVFSQVGFDLALGPELESDFYNFEAVNIPKDHPARDMQDTFFLRPDLLLRTHTSAIQVRTLEKRNLPLRILSPGAVYRCDSDSTHTPMFHQLEGLWVDRDVRMSHLKGILEYWSKSMFGEKTKIRLRASYFPFVEPGAELDVSCFQCNNQGCKLCKGTGWIEILGCGLVHPRLLERHLGKDQDDAHDFFQGRSWSGFAFGMGVERIAMLLHQVSDLRLFFQNDLRFLNQFGSSSLY